jgi:Zn-dependent peptidase ImmA (M78 family)
VALVLLPALPRSRVSGVSRWLAPNRALIQLSGRFKTDVQLWFTLFHEAGHLLLHSKKAIFLDGETRGESKAEREANVFAADLLIPPDEWARIRSVGNQGKWSYKKVREIAIHLGVSPGIVVGRLQYEGIVPRTHLNKVKVKIDPEKDWVARRS